MASNPNKAMDRRGKRPRRRSEGAADPVPETRREAETLGVPQQSSAGLQKDPSPSAVPDDDAQRYDRVRQRAYELYQRRGDGPGDDFADWLEAERQVESERKR